MEHIRLENPDKPVTRRDIVLLFEAIEMELKEACVLGPFVTPRRNELVNLMNESEYGR